LYFGAKLLVLDEPTAALSVKEAQKVLELVLKAREKGLSIILIAHNIFYIYPVVDRFVLLERGEKLGDVFKKDVTEEQIVQAVATGKRQWAEQAEIPMLS
jgi:simple sugar transport system ATP-binding protein